MNKRKTKVIFDEIRKDKYGLSITDLEKRTLIPRCAIRIIVTYLLGEGKIEFQRVGMAKIFRKKKTKKKR